MAFKIMTRTNDMARATVGILKLRPGQITRPGQLLAF